MISTFNLQKLQEMLHDFHTLTGIRITVFDDSFQEIISYPKDIAPICRYIRSNPEAESACRACDRSACRKAASLKRPYIYRCHAGLTEAVAPVMTGNIIVAYLLFGHLYSYQAPEDGHSAILKTCQRYHLDEQHLTDLIDQLPITSEDTILAASHILQAVASWLCMDRMITLRRESFPEQLDEYLNAHYLEPLTAETVCVKLHVGKTYLYQTARENYGCGVAEYVRRLRIEHAKRLLAGDRNLSVSEAAAMSGFDDPNHFITVFRKITGTTPGRYRSSVSRTP